MADNDGRIQSATRGTTAKAGRALVLTGKSRVLVKGRRGFAADAPFTLQAWVKPASGATTTAGALFGDAVALPDAAAWVAVPAQRWSNIALSSNGRQLRVYVDGDLKVTSGQTARGAASSSLSVGHSAQKGFHGALDDLRVYSRSLDAGELRGDMQTRVGAAGPGN